MLQATSKILSMVRVGDTGRHTSAGEVEVGGEAKSGIGYIAGRVAGAEELGVWRSGVLNVWHDIGCGIDAGREGRDCTVGGGLGYQCRLTVSAAAGLEERGNLPLPRKARAETKIMLDHILPAAETQ